MATASQAAQHNAPFLVDGATTWRLWQFGLGVLACGGAGGWWMKAGPWAALAWAATVLLGPATWLALLTGWAACTNREDRPDWRCRWRAWACECRWNLQVFGWQQPWRARACPDTAVPTPRRGVLLVHGHLCTRAFWLPWLQRLRSAGVPYATVELWPPGQDIDVTAPAIEAALSRLTDLTGHAPLVLAHSKGGLNVRAWRRWAVLQGDPAPERRLHALITVGTPHHGTLLARGARGTVAQLRPGSDWLRALAASESTAWRQRIGCVASGADVVVYPTSLACLEGAARRVVSSWPHIGLAFSPPVIDWVMEALQAPHDGLPW